jgi:hypothetical protein
VTVYRLLLRCCEYHRHANAHCRKPANYGGEPDDLARFPASTDGVTWIEVFRFHATKRDDAWSEPRVSGVHLD